MFSITSPIDCKVAYSILRDADFMDHANPEKIAELKDAPGSVQRGFQGVGNDFILPTLFEAFLERF